MRTLEEEPQHKTKKHKRTQNVPKPQNPTGMKYYIVLIIIPTMINFFKQKVQKRDQPGEGGQQ